MTPEHTEEWRPVAGFEGWYSVSTLGLIRRDPPAILRHQGRYILTPRPDRKGYLRVNLYRGSRESRAHCKIHQLVAAAFLGPCPPGHEVNHKNGVKTDNRADNLEWATRLENHVHARRLGLLSIAPKMRGERNPRAKLTDAAVRDIRRRVALGEAQTRLARAFGVTQPMIWRIKERLAWKHI